MIDSVDLRRRLSTCVQNIQLHVCIRIHTSVVITLTFENILMRINSCLLETYRYVYMHA